MMKSCNRTNLQDVLYVACDVLYDLHCIVVEQGLEKSNNDSVYT